MKVREIRRVQGYRIGQEVDHNGQSCVIKAFRDRFTAWVHYTGDHRTWSSGLVTVKELSR